MQSVYSLSRITVTSRTVSYSTEQIVTPTDLQNNRWNCNWKYSHEGVRRSDATASSFLTLEWVEVSNQLHDFAALPHFLPNFLIFKK
jgi:hypothetical protein